MKKSLRCVPLLSEFDKFIRVSKSGSRRKPDGSRLSGGTIESYENCRKVLVRFSLRHAEPEIYTGMKLTKQLFRDRSRYWKLFMCRFSDFMRACGYCETYVWNNQKILRAVMHFVLQQRGWPDTTLIVFKMPRLVQPDPITLSAEQVRALLEAEFSRSYRDQRLSNVRDIVVTGCITGLRYSDLMALTWDNLIRSEEKNWLRIQSQKTGVLTKLLIPDFLMSIIRRYRLLRRKRILPGISNVNLNIQIKNLGKWMGWDAPTQVMRSKSGILKVERIGKFYEQLTTHTMRRTCITLMLQFGMPEHLARQISGHAPNSREFYRYVKIAQNWQDEETERVHKEMFGQRSD